MYLQDMLGVRKMCARCAQDVCKVCERCVQDMCKKNLENWPCMYVIAHGEH